MASIGVRKRRELRVRRHGTLPRVNGDPIFEEASMNRKGHPMPQTATSFELRNVSESELQSVEGGALFVCAGGAAMSAITLTGLGFCAVLGTACLIQYLRP